MKIGIDVMGGDFAPLHTTRGALLASESLTTDSQLVFIGLEDKIRKIVVDEGVDPDRFEYVNATDVIGMGEHPTKAFFQKPESTINIGYQLLKSKSIDVLISAGNTGAMLVGAMFTIRSISGVIRPCITSVLPKTDGGFNVILDVGSNADCKPDVLFQFGLLGSIYLRHVYHVEEPKVALLNIGEEETKGNLLTRAAHEIMKDNPSYSFIGNVEGRDIFDSKADVIVCDGYTGNVVLKEAEAFYRLIKTRGLEDDYFARFNYENYGGTPILGVNGNVIIGHGSSTPLAVKNMITLASDVVEARLSDEIKKAFL